MKSLRRIKLASRRLAGRISTVAALLAAIVGGFATARAAEIHVRTDCRSDGGLVLLADVAEIFSTDADEVKALGKIDLVPAPAEGQKRYLRIREIEDLLVLRGINLRDHRFSGASKVTIVGVVDAASPRSDGLPAQPVSIRQVSDTLTKAIAAYLAEQDSQNETWIVKLRLTEQQAQAMADAKQLVVSGGTAPWTGKQSFTISGQNEKGPAKVTISPEVLLPPMMVVATRSMGRGVTVHPGDVRLQAGQPSEGKAHVFQSIDDVIGCETSRQVAEGQILDDQSVRPQVLIKRNEIVTVYSRTSGIQVRVTARAREEGAMGDLITIESLAQRETYFARVIGPQTAEVYAHAIPAHEDSAARPPNVARLQAAKEAMTGAAVTVGAAATQKQQ